jgi:hypothetical protein
MYGIFKEMIAMIVVIAAKRKKKKTMKKNSLREIRFR